ncbi:2-hydroxyacid dehydrogenase [Candidatus Pantoea multigeneris]|uniref:2-hydroxyacid dehydrogenase n=1 Tax=Candidatus Pantoea multigeneris TaxID=2608357 RepID=A0ABX0RKK7_9GAMM|nr:2-hydroxyacid dehydrogenase [Pantoea multigeneris]
MTDSNRPAVLLIASVPDALIQRLNATYTLYKLYEQTEPLAFLAQTGHEIQAVVTRGDVGVSDAVLENLSNVGMIAVFGVGTDAINLDYTRQKNIRISITSGVLTNDVADMALGLMLSGARNLCSGDRFVREQQWLKQAPSLGVQVSGKKLGIVGMGNIGQAIARRAAAFDMDIAYVSRTEKTDLPWRAVTSVNALAEQSDFLVIAASGGASTRHLIDANVIAAMPEHAWLINVARGSLVDEQALITALQNKQIAGAALDVFAEEPQVPEALLALDNVVLQPHVGSATHETRQRMGDVVFANLDAFFHQRPLPNGL